MPWVKLFCEFDAVSHHGLHLSLKPRWCGNFRGHDMSSEYRAKVIMVCLGPKRPRPLRSNMCIYIYIYIYIYIFFYDNRNMKLNSSWLYIDIRGFILCYSLSRTEPHSSLWDVGILENPGPFRRLSAFYIFLPGKHTHTVWCWHSWGIFTVESCFELLFVCLTLFI